MRPMILVEITALAGALVMMATGCAQRASEPSSRWSSDVGLQAAGSPFAGKVALVNVTLEGKHTYLSDLRLEEFAGKRFLVGKSIEPRSGNPHTGSGTWIAVEQIVRIDLFDNTKVVSSLINQAWKINEQQERLRQNRFNIEAERFPGTEELDPQK